MTAKRQAVSKTIRFEVFKRDAFTCQYCGGHPPAVVLELDHIVAVANGGGNGIDNLITSCFDCNRGKGARELSSIPQTVVEKAEMLQEREEQIRAFNKLKAGIRRRENRQINELEGVFSEAFDNRVFKDRFRESVRHNFLPKLSQDQLLMAIHKACSKCRGPEDSIKYFCGICWHIIKDKDNRT